jgi:hypothetical protein
MTGTLSLSSTELDTEAAAAAAAGLSDVPPFSSFLVWFDFFIHVRKKMEMTIFQNSFTTEELDTTCTFFLPSLLLLLKLGCGVKSGWPSRSPSPSRSGSSLEPASSRCRLGTLASLCSRRIPLCVSSATGVSPLATTVYYSLWRETKMKAAHVREESFAFAFAKNGSAKHSDSIA